MKDLPEHKLVFVVEDNEMYSLMLEYTVFTDSVIKCMCFKTAEECIQNIGLNPILVILDYWLPGMNGKEAFKKIKEIDPLIPVIILTRNHDAVVKEELMESGLYAYLQKEQNSVPQVKAVVNVILEKINKGQYRTLRNVKRAVYILLFIASSLAILWIVKNGKP